MKTTKEKIAIMEGYESGGELESRFVSANYQSKWTSVTNPVWDWMTHDYRIKPKPRVAREFWLEMHWSGRGETFDCKVRGETPVANEVIHVREVLPE